VNVGSEQEPILDAVGIRRRFGALAVLDGVDFSLGRGAAVGIVGPNGAGKTTLLNVLSGALPANAGTITFLGSDVTRASAARRCRLGVGRAHQVPKPFGGMTVFENVLVGAATGAGLRRQKAYERCFEVLELCALMDLANRRAESLGLIDRKRLELARALATDPVVLLLDEIGAGLTDAEAAELVDTIRRLSARGVAIVWIEHIVHVLVQVVERLVCMDAGRVIADGDPEIVMRDAAVIDAYLGRSAVA
jgi:branched-chain amino acid transport system ATP-binding protein